MPHPLQVVVVQLQLSCVDKVQEQLQAIAGTLLKAELHARCSGHIGLLEQLAETGKDVAMGQVDHPFTDIQHGITKPPQCPLLVQGGQDILRMAFLCSRHPSGSLLLQEAQGRHTETGGKGQY